MHTTASAKASGSVMTSAIACKYDRSSDLACSHAHAHNLAPTCMEPKLALTTATRHATVPHRTRMYFSMRTKF